MDKPIFLSLGTNLGDRLNNLHHARIALPPQVHLIQVSPIYVTQPWGFLEQPEFLNQVVEVRSELEPMPLLKYLKEIEDELGRQVTFRYGPRLIDLDILFYGDRVVAEDGLQIPHPRLHQRAFVLVPLNDIAPDFVHPVLKRSVQDLLADVDLEGIQKL